MRELRVPIFCLPGHCTHKLGVEDGTIPDSGLTASSQFGYATSEASPVTVRLNHGTFWSPRSDDQNPWVQVNIGSPTQVVGVMTQGGWFHDVHNVKIEQWVETFTVSSSYNDATMPFHKLTDGNGAVKVIVSFDN